MKTSNSSQTYIIGDVHGCFYTLKKLMAKIPDDAEIIFVGDLCDKGNYSKEVIDFVINGAYQCVKGNHEYLMQMNLYNAVKYNKQSPWSEDSRYGGVQTCQSYKNDMTTMLEHLNWIEKLPLYIEKGKYFITHGYALEFYEHKDQKEYYTQFLYNRYEKGMDVPPSDFVNVFGHCVFDEVQEGKNFFAIDTGCVYGGKLTAIKLGSMKKIQEAMDPRDSTFKITELEIKHLDPLKIGDSLDSFTKHIDAIFPEYDIVSNNLLTHMVKKYGEPGKEEVLKMLDKKQIFIKQAKKFSKIN